MIAVHCGAGYHKTSNYKQYNTLCRKACLKAIKVLRNGGTSLEAVKAAIIVLEDDVLPNAGFGSNLTSDGEVELDASVMDGKTLLFGGCGAVKNVKNPIALAYDICMKQREPLPLGLVPPSLLVESGAHQHAVKIGLPIISNQSLISKKALKQYSKYKRLLNTQVQANSRYDTVGAVCIDKEGHVAAACSSGGLILKRPGRIGQGALYGSGVWADSLEKEEPVVAVCTTGCGEHLIQTQLAKEIGEDLKNSRCLTTALDKTMNIKFLQSRHLRNVDVKLGGALVLHMNRNKEVSVQWAHSTLTMSVGYMKVTDKAPKAIISTLPDTIQQGEKINISGTYCCLT